MRCPSCNGFHLRVVLTYDAPMDGVGRAEKAVRRDRICTSCNHLFSTYEIIAERLEALKGDSREYRKIIGDKKLMAGAEEKKRAKLNTFLMQNTKRKFILEGMLIKEPRELPAEDVALEIDKFTRKGGKMPRIKDHGMQTFIIFDANKWVRVV